MREVDNLFGSVILALIAVFVLGVIIGARFFADAFEPTEEHKFNMEVYQLMDEVEHLRAEMEKHKCIEQREAVG